MGDTVVAAAIAAQALAVSTAIGSGSAAVASAIAAHSASLISYDTAKQTTVTGFAVAELVAYGAQLVTYYNAAKDSIDDRDDAIDKQVSFMQYLQDTRVNADLPMVQDQLDVLTDLDLPDVLTCGSGNNVAFQTWRDGVAVDDTANKLTDQAPGSRPNTFGEHSGRLYGMKFGSYAHGIVSNADVRRQERFRKNKTQLVRQAHSNSKSIYSAGEVLSRYAQVTGIHSGLADLYIQGFNSAGAGLGVALGKLANGTIDGNSANNDVSGVD